ncbi:MAG: DNA translocase FtsK 4TM domain-containing protein, partial [Candidatus Gracilibacteria bacterium]
RLKRLRNRSSFEINVEPKIAREIWAIIYMAVGILTIFSLKGTFGIVGDLWVNLLRPIMGWGIYVIPAVLIIISLMMFFAREIYFGAAKIFGFILFMVSILSIFHLSVPIEKLYEFAAEGRYGGYVGFVTNFILISVLGISAISATIIFIAVFLVSLLLIFEVPLREIISFIMPQIKVEHVKKGEKKEDDFDDEIEEIEMDPPEILIHKSSISNSSRKKDDVIYEEESGIVEGVDEEARKDKIKINESRAKKISAELSKNEKQTEQEEYVWEFPSLDLLKEGTGDIHVDDKLLMDNADKIKKKLQQFGIEVAMHEVNVGPTVIQYTLKPSEGVKLSKITTLKNDLALALAAERIRIEAPIPGKSLVGMEVPNSHRSTVYLKEILQSNVFIDSKSKLTFPLGRDVSGKPMVACLDAMPHLLIAGATGSGKSVAMNSFLISLLYQNAPKDLKMILIDPKRVELNSYNNIPHLLTPVIQDPEKAAISLRWVVAEMTRRYTELSSKRVRNIAEYNDLKDIHKLPRIIVVVDELADLMMVAGKEVEASICRIAQMARAVGIHLIIATQRPSVDVITGLIKANIPTRIAFAVSSQIDSRTILDGMGAEDLLGKGDMLYLPVGNRQPVRIQGVMITTEEIERVTNRVKLTVEPDYDESIVSNHTAKEKLVGVPDSKAGTDEDDLYEQAFVVVQETKKASASLLQRRLKVGYARAARLIDLLEENGVVGPADGAKPRKIMM